MRTHRPRAVTAAIAATLAFAWLVLPGVASPVAAECSGPNTWPLFQHVAPRATQIVIGAVVRGPRRSATQPEPVVLRVDERIRGQSPSTVVLRDLVATGDCIPFGLTVRPGDRLAVAWAPSAGWADGVKGPVSGVAFVGGQRPRDPTRDGAMPRMQRLTERNVRQLARLPATDLLLFTADDGIHGRELWRSDGTRSQTRLVRDIVRGAVGSEPRDLVVDRGFAYFSADDGIHGREPWVTDGTAAGTRMLSDVHLGASGSDPTGLVLMYDGVAFAADDGVHGREPWASAGAAVTTRMLADIRPGTAGSDPSQLAYVNGALIMSADDGVHGREPWSVYEGEATGLVADLWPGPGGSDPSGIVAYAYDPLFIADAGDGRRVWRAVRGSVDGDEGWLPPVDMFGEDLAADSDPRDMFVLEEVDRMPVVLWFSAIDRTGQRRAYVYRPAYDVHDDELAGTLVPLPVTAPGDQPWTPTSAGRRLFFAAEMANDASAMAVTEGTSPSTYAVLAAGSFPISGIATLDGYVAAGARSTGGVRGPLWVGDGTIYGMTTTSDRQGWSPGDPSDLTRLDRWIAFVAERVPPGWAAARERAGRELWATGPWPGWSHGTRMVRDIRPGPASSEPRDLVWLRSTSDLH